MAKRPTSTKAKGHVNIAAPSGEDESLRIRPISNGFIIRRSGMKRGRYFEHEEFSATKPVITASVPAKRKP